MLARARTFTIEGISARPVTVEVDIRAGLPSFTIVGRADAAVREARERVHAAVLNSGYEFPARRITANLAPADVPKIGPGLDLALACAVLAASKQVSGERLEHCALFGELTLDGRAHAAHGTLAVAEAAVRAGITTLLLAPARAREAMLVEGLSVGAVESLSSAVRVLDGGKPDRLPDARPPAPPAPARPQPDLADVRGQPHAVGALLLAAAGGHNCLLWGAPGTGKTMLARRLPSILPPLARAESIELMRILSVAGRAFDGELPRERPFRAPHHSVTTAGLIGGAGGGCVGEAVLAHNGVLFLDELCEFSRAALDALRQPLEEARVAIARARHRAVYPARFMLVAATNPCPCGYAGQPGRCRCRPAELDRHRRRLSGPLLDRLDMLIGMGPLTPQDLKAPPTFASAQAQALVVQARERQARRLAGEGVLLNAHMDAAALRRHAMLGERAERALAQAHRGGMLSARGRDRLLRVARTAADLDGSERIAARHVATALSMRAPAAPRAG